MKYDVIISEITTYRVEAISKDEAYEKAHSGAYDLEIVSQQTQTEDIYIVEEEKN